MRRPLRTHRRSMFALCSVALSCTPAFARQGGVGDPLPHYQSIVSGYIQNDKGAVDGVLPWSEKQIADVLSRIDTDADPFRPWTVQRYKAAVMLHTDAALRGLGKDETAMPHHLDAGLTLVGKAAAHRLDLRGFASRWCLAVSRLLRDRIRAHSAAGFLAKSRERLPDDAMVLFESGAVAEELATDYALETDVAFTDGMDRRAVERTIYRLVNRRTEHLTLAAGWFERAIATEPTDPARLHQARVRMLLGQDEEALRLLAEVRSSADRQVAYVAALFAAAVHERNGRLEDAAAAYTRALGLYPRAHAATIGLSEVWQRTGKGDGSREVLRRLLNQPLGVMSDPWWWYQFEPAGAADARITAMREEARR